MPPNIHVVFRLTTIALFCIDQLFQAIDVFAKRVLICILKERIREGIFVLYYILSVVSIEQGRCRQVVTSQFL